MVLTVKADFISRILEGILQPLGGVYYVDPDFKTVTPIIQNISMNGIAFKYG